MNNINFQKGVHIIYYSMSKRSREKTSLICENGQIWFGNYLDMHVNHRVEMEILGWFVDNKQWSCYA